MLLAPLKVQNDAARKLLPMFLENLSDSQQHSCVGVMTTGVDSTVSFADADLGLLVVIGVFLHGQRINVCPEQYGLAGLNAFDKAHNAALGNVCAGDAVCFQLLQDMGNGIVLVIGKLRVFMEPPAKEDHMILLRRCKFPNIHSTILFTGSSTAPCW